MTLLDWQCDRCGRSIWGGHYASVYLDAYVVDWPSAWEKYGRPGEHTVCDECIESMPKYREDRLEREPA